MRNMKQVPTKDLPAFQVEMQSFFLLLQQYTQQEPFYDSSGDIYNVYV